MADGRWFSQQPRNNGDESNGRSLDTAGHLAPNHLWKRQVDLLPMLLICFFSVPWCSMYLIALSERSASLAVWGNQIIFAVSVSVLLLVSSGFLADSPRNLDKTRWPWPRSRHGSLSWDSELVKKIKLQKSSAAPMPMSCDPWRESLRSPKNRQQEPEDGAAKHELQHRWLGDQAELASSSSKGTRMIWNQQG